ncbi:serine protease inhibitor serpin [Holotrichia oblita]|uniref:Serine protease inhibitor serpin n=1 Tax=Holotrichia oblita TaxID=644536 RepID=A0ACB9T724_HOLOL|nr:serine protease inhibitor serpin [Holotrichia oblita]
MANLACNGITHLSYKLYDALSKKEGNILFSPLSIHAILSMIYQGATGQSAENLEKVLAITGAKKSADSYEALMETVSYIYSVKVCVANKIFAQSPFKDDFSATVTKSYFAETETLDLSNGADASGKINSWTEEKSENRIKDIVSAGNLAGSKLVLASGLDIKGDWLIQFEEKDTKKRNSIYRRQTQ